MARRAKSVRISGMKQLKAALAEVKNELDGQDVYNALRRAAEPLQKAVKRNLLGVSVTVYSSVNLASQIPRSMPKKKTALVVVHKADTMREWTAAQHGPAPLKSSGRSRDSKGRFSGEGHNPVRKVAAGGKVAESLASMIELGTSRMPAKPYFQPAVQETKGEMVETLKTELYALITVAAAKGKGSVSDD